MYRLKHSGPAKHNALLHGLLSAVYELRDLRSDVVKLLEHATRENLKEVQQRVSDSQHRKDLKASLTVEKCTLCKGTLDNNTAMALSMASLAQIMDEKYDGDYNAYRVRQGVTQDPAC